MTDELRAAVERLRTSRDRRQCVPVSCSTLVGHQEYCDLMAVRNAYLAAYGPDDDESVTRDWLREHTMNTSGEAMMWSYEFGGGISVMGVGDDPPSDWKWNIQTREHQYADLPVQHTRGQVRRLFQALEIGIEETKP